MTITVAHISSGEVGAAVVVVALIVAAVLALRAEPLLTTRMTGLLALAAGALTFQVVHLVEHVMQAIYWTFNSSEPPWLTPWADLGRSALAGVRNGDAAFGNELLHLLGNVVFLVGLVAALAVARDRRGERAQVPWLRRSLLLQGVHIGEHFLLTSTLVLGGTALGLTNLFGLIEAGTVAASSTRVWVHFALNLSVTALAVRGMSDVFTPEIVTALRRRPPAVAVGSASS